MEDLKELAKEHQKMFKCKICGKEVPNIDEVYSLIDSHGRDIGDVHIECLEQANRLIEKGGLEEIMALYADYG